MILIRCHCSRPQCGHAGRCYDNAKFVTPGGQKLCATCARIRLGNQEPAQHYERLEVRSA